MIGLSLSYSNTGEDIFYEEDSKGALIEYVLPGSPAEKSGLLTGMIIQEVERNAVKNLEIFI